MLDNTLNTNEVTEFLKIIQDENNKNLPSSYSFIKNAFLNLSIPFPSISVPKGTILYRTRPHLNGEYYFKYIHQISYRPDKYKIKYFGRANEPCQPIFYCSNSDKVAFVETSEITRKNTGLPSETLTTGVWKVQSDLRVASLISNEEIRGLNKTQDGLNVRFCKLIDKTRNQGTEDLYRVLKTISTEFTQDVGTDNSKYKISCAFANYIYETNGYSTYDKKQIKLDGILYPSTIYPSDGMNLAIKPQVIDERKMILISARKGTMSKKKANSYFEENVIDAKEIDNERGLIIWK